MKILNFIVSGLLGDLIHSLYACRNICLKEDAKANLYIAEGFMGEPFRYGLNKAFEDTYRLIVEQDYINKYDILPDNLAEPTINLNSWRSRVHKTYATTGAYDACWTDIMAETFDFKVGQYQWIDVSKLDNTTSGRVLIHRSRKRHNSAHSDFITNLTEMPLFITTNHEEYEQYEFRELVEPYVVNDIYDMASAIKSSRLFVGNQSSPFALASALDANRLVELCPIDAAIFYRGESKYSRKIGFIFEPEKSMSTNSYQQSSPDDKNVSTELANDTSYQNLLDIAFAHHQARRLDEAECFYRQILRYYLNDFVALHMLGVVRSQLGDLIDAEKLLQQAIGINGVTPQAYYNLGNVYAGQSRLTDARSCFWKALSLDSNFILARQQLDRVSF